MKLQITTKSGEIIYYISKVIDGRTVYHPIYDVHSLFSKGELSGLVGTYVTNGGSAIWIN